MAQCHGPRAQIRLFFGLHLYLAGKYFKNLKVPEAQLNVNPARAIKCFVGVTTVSTVHFSMTNLHLANFYATKYF